MPEPSNSPPSKDSIPFYPEHVSTELRVVVGILILAILIGLVGMFYPVGLGDPADAMNTPAHVKPEWYFLALYQMLKYVPKTAGAVFPVIAMILLILWPFIDRKPETSPTTRRTRFIATLFILFLILAMTVWGEMS